MSLWMAWLILLIIDLLLVNAMIWRFISFDYEFVLAGGLISGALLSPFVHMLDDLSGKPKTCCKR